MSTQTGGDFAARHWFRFSPLSLLLIPLSLLFRMAVFVRRQCYQRGLLPVVRLPVPVIVIGNLTVGGTGKTPLVLWTVSFLQRHGYRPGILLRGYGAASVSPRGVGEHDDPAVVGDEALLLARSARCPVWIGADRAAAGAGLLRARPECDIIISDDGLQHYALARDLEIALEDNRGHGNGLMLPAGPMREPASRRVDATVVNGGAGPGDGTGRSDRSGSTAAGGRVFAMQLAADGFFDLDGAPVDISALRGKGLHAVAGIGNPARFFASLRELGLDAVGHAFADHHAYRPQDLTFEHCDFVLMTEKDAVKCAAFNRTDLLVFRIHADPEPSFGDYLLKAVHGFSSA